MDNDFSEQEELPADAVSQVWLPASLIVLDELKVVSHNSPSIFIWPARAENVKNFSG